MTGGQGDTGAGGHRDWGAGGRAAMLGGMERTVESLADVCFRGKFYSSVLPFRVGEDGERVLIEAAAFPRGAVVALNAVFAAFFAGWIYVCLHFGRPGERVLAVAAGGGIGLLLCAFFTGTMIFTYRRAAQKGPVLVYHRGSKTVELPRVGRVYPAGEVRLQWLHLTGAQREEDGGSELQLRHEAAGREPETILLITSSLRIGVLQKSVGVWDRILRPMRRLTPLEVVSVAMRDRETAAGVGDYPV